MVEVPKSIAGSTVVYARVSSSDQAKDLKRQVARLGRGLPRAGTR